MDVYSVVFENQTITNANGDYDLFEFTPADDYPITLLGIKLSQHSEVGDTQEEQLRVSVVRGHTVSGNGTATTPRHLRDSSKSANFTAETVASTIANTGTTHILDADGFNVRTGGLWLPPPELWMGADQGDTTLVVRMSTTVADDISLSGTAWVREGLA